MRCLFLISLLFLCNTFAVNIPLGSYTGYAQEGGYTSSNQHLKIPLYATFYIANYSLMLSADVRYINSGGVLVVDINASKVDKNSFNHPYYQPCFVGAPDINVYNIDMQLVPGELSVHNCSLSEVLINSSVVEEITGKFSLLLYDFTSQIYRPVISGHFKVDNY